MSLSISQHSPFSSLNGSLPSLDGGEGVCNDFYGTFTRTADCITAVDGLAKGSEIVPYTIDRGFGQHSLPLSSTYGNCVIQVEIGGPRHGNLVNIKPDRIRSMADTVIQICLQDNPSTGGFLTSDLYNLKQWITLPTTNLDDYYPIYTAFLTVTVSNLVQDWSSPGNYDPEMATLLGHTALDASAKAFPSTGKIVDDLRRRGNRFLRAAQLMTPRGHRFPWFERPSILTGGNNATGSGADANATASLVLPATGDDGVDTTVSRRRRRRFGK